MTYAIFSIVIDVSAIFVATTIFPKKMNFKVFYFC